MTQRSPELGFRPASSVRSALPVLASAVLLLVVGACDARSGPGGGGAAAKSSSDPGTASAVDTAALIAPGTKGLVVLNPFGNRPTFYDFDRVQYGAQLRHTFQIKNDEAHDLAILDLMPSCGCTHVTARYADEKGEYVVGSREPGTRILLVPRGVTFEIVCEIDTTSQIERMNLDKLTQVRMRSDSPTLPFLTFELHLLVERTFRSVPAVMDLGRVPRSAGKSAHAEVSHDAQGSAAGIVGVGSVDGPFTATVDETDRAGNTYWIVNVETAKGLPFGPVRGKVHLTTTGDDGKGTGTPFEIPITGEVVPEIVASPAVFAFGSVPSGTQKRVSIELLAVDPTAKFRFLGASVQGDAGDVLALARTPKDPDADGRASQWSIELATPGNLRVGAFAGTVSIQTDDPHVPYAHVPYNGTVK